MFLKLDYVFTSLSFSLSPSLFFFLLCEVKLGILFFTYFNNNIKNRCQSKIILGHAVFQLLFESKFSLQLSLLLNSSIR